MKGVHLIIILLITLIGCDKFSKKNVFITFENRSTLKLAISKQTNEPDTLIHDDEYSEIVLPGEKSDLSTPIKLSSDKNRMFVTIFLYNKDTLDKYGFDYVKNGYKIVRRYDLVYYNKKKDRNLSSNFNLIYP